MIHHDLLDLLTCAVYSPKIRAVLRAYAKRIEILGEDEHRNIMALLKVVTQRHGTDCDPNKLHIDIPVVASSIQKIESTPELFDLCMRAESGDSQINQQAVREVSENCDFCMESLVNSGVNAANIAIFDALGNDHKADLTKLVAARDRILREGSGETHRTLVDIGRDIRAAGEVDVYPTGIDSLDRIIKPVPGSMMVLGGMSGTGKTTLANQIIINMMQSTGLRCLYFSLEVTDEMTYKTMHTYLCGKTSEPDRELHKLPLNVYTRTFTLQGIVDEIRARHAQDPTVRFVLVDYLQVVEVANAKDEIKAVGDAIRTLQNITTELGLFSIIISQLRKETSTQSKQGSVTSLKQIPPDHNDFRGSGLVFNAAYFALALYLTHPEDKFGDNSCGIFREKCRVLKNKAGQTGDVKLTFEAKNRTFVSGWETFEP